MSEKKSVNILIPQWVKHSNKPISTVDFHPSGEYFATGGWDTYCKIWNLPKKEDESKSRPKLLALLHGHDKSINCVRFSPDGKYLATCGDDYMVFLWQRNRSFGPPSTFGIPKDALEPNLPIQRWSFRSLNGNSEDVTSISWFQDSQRIASCSIGGLVCVWDIKTSTLLWNHRASMGAVSISVDPLTKFIAIQLLNGSISILDIHGRFIKIIGDEFIGSERAMISRICWTTDGSFLGMTSGWSQKHIVPFFQRETFNFGFILEGHVSPISCISSSPILFRNSNGSYSSLIACADKQGVLSIWMAGSEASPLFVLNGFTSSMINDISWSNDSKWLVISLEADFENHSGGLVLFDINNSISNEKIDIDTVCEIKSRLMGENSFKFKSSQTSQAQALLKSIDNEEKDIDLEILQLTTEEVINKQIIIKENDQIIIQPVLLTATQKKTISFKTYISGEQLISNINEFQPKHLKWEKPVALNGIVTHTLEINNFLIICYDNYLLKLSKITGRRLSTPLNIGSKCKHLSFKDNLILVVGKNCFVISLINMKLLNSIECPEEFTYFNLINCEPITVTANFKGKIWIWDESLLTWTGGAISEDSADFTLNEIEKLTNLQPHEDSTIQWFDFGISAIFYSYIGQKDKSEQIINDLELNSYGAYSKNFINDLKNIIKKRWNF